MAGSDDTDSQRGSCSRRDPNQRSVLEVIEPPSNMDGMDDALHSLPSQQVNGSREETIVERLERIRILVEQAIAIGIISNQNSNNHRNNPNRNSPNRNNQNGWEEK